MIAEHTVVFRKKVLTLIAFNHKYSRHLIENDFYMKNQGSMFHWVSPSQLTSGIPFICSQQLINQRRLSGDKAS